MVKEIVERESGLPDSEPKKEMSPREAFLNKLYVEILDWLTKERDSKILAEFKPQHVSYWENHEDLPGRNAVLALDLQKAVIIQTPTKNFALVLGERRRSKWDRKQTLGVQFGVKPASQMSSQKNPIDNLRSLVNQRPFGHGSGEFYIHPDAKKLIIDCWADESRFTGGREIKDWPEERLITEKGLEACLEIVQRTSRNAFIWPH